VPLLFYADLQLCFGPAPLPQHAAAPVVSVLMDATSSSVMSAPAFFQWHLAAAPAAMVTSVSKNEQEKWYKLVVWSEHT
jgi:hypothetical protein